MSDLTYKKLLKALQKMPVEDLDHYVNFVGHNNKSVPCKLVLVDRPGPYLTGKYPLLVPVTKDMRDYQEVLW